jgi:DNA polymerase I-like protein with 3'-5' exonuclease and polymerase domains
MSDQLYSLDIETTGLDSFKDRILGIGIYRPSFSTFFTDLADFENWLKENPSARFICHRGSFDINFLRRVGCDIRERFSYDTRSLASILSPAPVPVQGEKHALSLQNLGMALLGLSAWKLDRENMAGYAIEEVAHYCLKDCKVTYDLFFYIQKSLSKDGWDFVHKWLMPATRFCAELEFNGVHINQKGLAHYRELKTKQRDRVLGYLQKIAQPAIKTYHELQVRNVSTNYREMYEKAKTKSKDQTKCLRRYALLESAAVSRLEPFNWNSSEQLKWLLRDYYGLDIRNEREDKETTNEAMLRDLAPKNRTARVLLLYRELEKLVSTCIPALLDNCSIDGGVHASYNVGGTRTGRLSSSSPNLQQIPRGSIRSYITAKAERSLVTIDYSQIEVRLIAHLAKEKELINAFKEGIDPYSIIAQKLLKIDCPVKELKKKFPKERDVSKTAGLSIFYGTGARKLQEVLRKELGRDYSVSTCKQFIEDYRNDFSGVKTLRAKLDRDLANGKVSFNLLGRPFSLPSNDEIYMKGLNTLVQGSASDLVIYSQIARVEPALKALGIDYTYRMLIHDEVVLELNADEAELLTKEVIIPEMTINLEKELKLSVPLAVEYHIGPVWEKP